MTTAFMVAVIGTQVFMLVILYFISLAIEGDNKAIRADLSAQSAMQQRRYDDVIGLCERIEKMLEAQKPLPSVTSSPFFSRLPKPVDFETSQQQTLKEFEEQ